MGQYYYPVNISKKEYLHPHKFGDGLKLMEFALGSNGVMTGLAILLADGNGRGGGDIKEDPVSKIVGRWAGDKIAIAGDYADEGRFVTQKDCEGITDDKDIQISRKKINLHGLACEKFRDISWDVIFAVMADEYARSEYMKSHDSFDERHNAIIRDFNSIHEMLAASKNDAALLVGRLKTDEGRTILEQLLKRGKQ